LLFNFALECATRKVQETQVGLKLNGTHQAPVYTDDINTLRENINITNQNRKVLLHNGLEVYTEKTKYMVMSRTQNAEQNHNLLIANESSEIVTKFKYLGSTIKGKVVPVL
jgi:hypothetical protein